ncbi:MAG: hypothetical protein NTV86_13430 [Planctomycetota bacterium]|nr:hypothetical protein [Planctomycetota bacterium]
MPSLLTLGCHSLLSWKLTVTMSLPSSFMLCRVKTGTSRPWHRP